LRKIKPYTDTLQVTVHLQNSIWVW